MRLHHRLPAGFLILILLAACGTAPESQKAQPAQSAASAPAADGADEKNGAGTGLSLPELSESRMNAYELSLVLPVLPEPEAAGTVAVAGSEMPVSGAKAQVQTAPEIVESGHRALPAADTANSAREALPEPAAPAAKKTAVQSPAAAPAAPAKPAASGPAAAKPAAAANKEQAKKEEVPVPAFASTPTAAEASAESAAQEPDIAQHIAVELGQRVEVPLDGTGWTYLGEKNGKDGVLYESRRYSETGLVFVLNPNRAGSYILRFQKQDALRGRSYDEYVELTVKPKTLSAVSGNAGTQTGTSSSPAQSAQTQNAAGTQASGAKTGSAAQTATVSAAGAQAQEQSAGAAAQTAGSSQTAAAQSQSGGSQSSTQAGSTEEGAVSASDSSSAAVLSFPPDSPEGLIQTAKNALSAGKIAEAVAALDRFLSLYPAGMDEVYYLYGYAFEQNGPYRDIRKAYNYYKKVSDDYPESELWSKAKERASYIERHYFEIR